VADAARARAARAVSGKPHRRVPVGYVQAGKTYDTTPVVCKCDSAWSDGEGSCVRCGRSLPQPEIEEVLRAAANESATAR
jgi:hypothetical protein